MDLSKQELNQQAYFLLNSDQHKDYNSILIPDNDLMALDILDNSVLVYPTIAGILDSLPNKVVVNAIIGPELQKDLREIVEQERWDSLITIRELGLEAVYVGRELTDREGWGLFWFLPELKGNRAIEIETEEGIITEEIGYVSTVRWP